MDEDFKIFWAINFCSMGMAILAMACIGWVSLLIIPFTEDRGEWFSFLGGAVMMTICGLVPLGLCFSTIFIYCKVVGN